MTDTAAGGSAGAAIVAANQHHVGLAFGHARGNGADPHLRNQLDIDAGLAVGVFEIVDKFGQVFNRVDVVVGRGRD